MAFVLDWQKKLGYRNDPFIVDPGQRVQAFFVDREAEREKINLFIIKRGKVGILQGAKGAGKTTLLRWVAEELEHHGLKGNVLLLADEKVLASKNKLLQALLERNLSVLERTVTKPHEKLKGEELEKLLLEKLAKRHSLIIVDDAQALEKEQLDLLKTILQSCPEAQVILALERVLKAHEALGNDDLGLSLEEMSDEHLTELLEKRIALAGGTGTFPFEDEDIEKLLAGSKKNLVKLLELARERAIDLSVKVKGPPQPIKATERPKEAATARAAEAAKTAEAIEKIAPEPKKKWFSIKFVKEEEQKNVKEKKEQKELPPDAELLDKLVTTAENAKEAPQKKAEEPKPKTEAVKIDKAIETVVEQLPDLKPEKVEKTEKKKPATRGVIIKSKRR